MFYLTPSRTVEENFYDMLTAATGITMTANNIQVDAIAALDGNGGTAVTISSLDDTFATGSVTLTYNRISMTRIDDWPWNNTIAVSKPTIRTPQSLLDAFNAVFHTGITLADLDPIDAAGVPPGPLAKCNYTAKSTNLMYFGTLYI